ncbi:MAG: hypothetical protein LDL07_11125, partial [Desulfarculus sp.]|nr:hypothetical protein [Desulfarculus sp.]
MSAHGLDAFSIKWRIAAPLILASLLMAVAGGAYLYTQRMESLQQAALGDLASRAVAVREAIAAR